MGKFLKYPKYALLTIFSVLNILCVVGMIVCAYSAYISPASHPKFSFLGMIFPAFLIATALFIFFWMLFKPKFMLISIIGMLLCARSIRSYCPMNFFNRTAPEGSLKVVSFNIYHLEFLDNAEKVPIQEHPSVDYLLDIDADIVCCQETGNMRRAVVRERMEKVYPYSNYEAKWKDMMAVFSKYPILTEYPIPFGSKTNMASAYEILLAEGDTLLLLNCHLESYKLNPEDKDEYKSIIENPEGEENKQYIRSLRSKLSKADAIRAAQADKLVEFIENCHHKKIILCGDFNSSPISYVHHRLTQVLNDAYTRSGNGLGISYYRNGFYFRIDHILCSPNFTAYGAKVDSNSKSSDHHPIYCWLKDKDKKQ